MSFHTGTQQVPNNYLCFVLQTNADDAGGFLQVQHYWGVNICCKVLNLGSMKIAEPSCAYQKVYTFWDEQK